MALSEHLEKLRHFYRLSDFRSINEASRAIGISQAGLSKSLSSLEDVLEVSLFVRSNEGLVLTKEGELVLSAARKILDESSNLEATLKSMQAPKSPQALKIGLYDSIAVYLFGSLAEYMRTVYPSVDLRIFVETSAGLAKALNDGDVDLSIGVNLQRRKTASEEFFLLFEDYYSFYVSAKVEGVDMKGPLLIHPLADDLESITIEKHLKKLIFSRGAHKVYNFETLKTLTLQGLGIGVLPTQVAKPLIKLNQLKAIQIPRQKAMFGLHSIGLLVESKFLEKHREFVGDLYRLGQHWTKI